MLGCKESKNILSVTNYHNTEVVVILSKELSTTNHWVPGRLYDQCEMTSENTWLVNNP